MDDKSHHLTFKDVPKSENEGEMSTKRFMISTILKLEINDVILDPVPMFRETKKPEIPDVFLKKCIECEKICDFSIEVKDKQAKKDKKLHLQDFSRYFQKNAESLSPELLNSFYHMAVTNISRPFPIVNAKDGDQVFDTSWEHLELVYDSLISLFKTPVTVNYPPLIITEMLLFP